MPRESLAETRERLRRRWGDYPLTILVFNPINLRLARWLGDTPVTPNQLTVVSFVMMAVAAVCFGAPSWPVQAVGGVLLWLSYLIDCLDGDLARYKQMKSPLGAMLDPMLDRFGEVLVGAGAAIGGFHLTGNPVWLVGGLALVGFSQVYFYLVDVMVKKLPAAPVPGSGAAAEAIVVPKRMLRGTPVRFGAIEPYLWGLSLLALAGRVHWGVPVFGAMFALGSVGQLVRVVRALRRSELGEERFNTHVRDSVDPEP